MSRVIISDDKELQIQADETTQYIYRKDYMGTGDQINEYSLSLSYSRKITGEP